MGRAIISPSTNSKYQLIHTNVQQNLRHNHEQVIIYTIVLPTQAQLQDAAYRRTQSRVQRLKDISRTGGEYNN